MSTKRNTRRQLKMESLEDRKLMTVMVEFAEMGVRDHLRSEIPSIWTSGGTSSVRVGHESGKLKMGGQEGEALKENIAIEKVTDAVFADDNDVKDTLRMNIGSEHWPDRPLIWVMGGTTRLTVGDESGTLQLGGQEGEALTENIAIEKVTDAIFARENDGSLVNMASPHCPIDVLDIWTNGSGTRVKDSMHQGAMNSVAGNNLQHGSDALHLGYLKLGDIKGE